jgi:iron complex transport system ATP-binding protein
MTGVRLEQVGVRRGDRTVVHDITLEIGAGGWLCLIGPNGAGKTTLLHALAALLPHEGRIALGDHALSEMSRRDRARRIALVQQDAGVPVGVRVADYVMLGRTPYISYFGREGRDDRRVVADVLAQLDLLELADRPVDQLSGGERQRVVLARALAQGPSILLLDEPTTALDLGRQLQVLELIRAQQRAHDLTVISATHDLTLAAAYADRLALISLGGLVADGTPHEVLTTAILGEHYGVPLRVIHDGDGGVAVIPLRSTAPGADPGDVL